MKETKNYKILDNFVLAAILIMCLVVMVICLVNIRRDNIMLKGYDNLVLNANLCLDRKLTP